MTGLAKEGHYQKACAAQFRHANKGMEISTGMTNHPNQFYLESKNGVGCVGCPSAAGVSNVKKEKVNSYGSVARSDKSNVFKELDDFGDVDMTDEF